MIDVLGKFSTTMGDSAAAVLDFAVTELLRDDEGRTLPAVLARLVRDLGLSAAAAIRLQPSVVLAAWPPGTDGEAVLAQLEQAAGQGGALVSYAAPVALALYSDVASWDEEVRHIAHAVAALVAARVGRAGELAGLASQTERVGWLDIISHELRTPLTSIVSFSELIRGEAIELTADGQQFLDVIERNADRLLRLTGDLLLLDRLAAGSLPLDLAPVPVAELVGEAVRGATTTAAMHGITVTGTTAPGPPVLGDARRLAQVLDNLTGNAVKYSHKEGAVRITASYAETGEDGPRWRIDVADSGIGIPPGEAGRMFSRFARASNARTAGLPGSGLGLPIVQLIVAMHGGRVEVDSALEQGSTFSVYLPVSGPS